MKYLILLSLFLVSCGDKTSYTKLDIISCELQDDFIGPYPKKVVCETNRGEVEINIKNSITYVDINYLEPLSHIEFLKLEKNPRSGYSITVRGCTADHRCEVLYASGDKIFEYTKAITF